jgi:hypothetical protein
MNIKQISLLVFVALVSAAIAFLLVSKGFISLSDTTVAKSTIAPEITFKINGDELEITSITGGTDPDLKKCRNTKKKNCIKVKRGFAGLVAYTFDNDDDDWVLKQFTICRGLDKITTTCTADLDRNERLEFFIMNNAQGDEILLTPKSGEVDLTQLKDDSLRTFFLFDQNTIKRDYFYNIQVCKPETESETETCLTLDPPVENRGRR